MPKPNGTSTAPDFFDPIDEVAEKKPEKKAADDARDALAGAAWTKPEAAKVEQPKPEQPGAEKAKAEPKAEQPKIELPKVEVAKADAPKVEAPKSEQPKAEAPKAEVPKVEAPKVELPKLELTRVADKAATQKRLLERIEGVEDWSIVDRNPAKKANYIELRRTMGVMAPYLQIENLQGKAEDDFKTTVLRLFDKEKNPDTIAAIKKLIESAPGAEREKQIQDLKSVIKDADKVKLLDGLAVTEELRANERDMLGRLQNGFAITNGLEKLASTTATAADRQQAREELQQLLKDDPDKLKQLKEIGDDANGRQRALELLKTVEKENYMATMASYPTVARFIDYASRSTHGQFQEMKIGDPADPRSEHRFPEGAPFSRIDSNGQPLNWDLYLTKVRNGELPSTVSPKLEGLLSSDRTVAFVAASEWLNKSTAITSGIERRHDIEETWTRLKNGMGAPESWAPPKTNDARQLDAWFSAANTVRREISTLRDYVQAYLDLKEVTPDLREKTINDLKAKGYKIEWNELNHKLTKFEPPVPADLRILSPKVNALIKDWQEARRELAKPIDKLLETYAKGDKNFLKQGTFTGPQDRGFLLMENGKVKFVVESDEVKKEDGAKKVEEAKAALKKVEDEKTSLEADLTKQRTKLDSVTKGKQDLTELEKDEKLAAEKQIKKLEGEIVLNKFNLEQAQSKVAKAEAEKDGGKFPGSVISYIRRVDGKEETIDRNLQGKFITKAGVDVTDEVDYKPENFKDKNRVQFDYVNYSVKTETAKDAAGKDIIGVDGQPQIRITTHRDFMGDHMVNMYHQFGENVGSLDKSDDRNTNDYVGVVSNTLGTVRFLRADDIGGYTGWKAGQQWQEGLTLAANVAMDAAMIYVGGAGIYSGIAKRAFGEVAISAMRLGIGLTGMPFGPALRQSEIGKKVLEYRHYAMMFDVFVLGLGGSAMNMLRGGAQVAEKVSLGQKIAHYTMLSTTAVYGPEILSDIYHKAQMNRGEAPLQLAEKVGRHIVTRSEQLDRMAKPYDMKDPAIRKATGDGLDSYAASMLPTIEDPKAKANVQAMFDSTKKMLEPTATATEKDEYKKTLLKTLRDGDPQRRSTPSEKVAAAACLIQLNTDEKGAIAEKLAGTFTYKDALKVLNDNVNATPDSVVAKMTALSKRSQAAAAQMIRQYMDVDQVRADDMARILSGAQPGPIQDLLKKRMSTQLEGTRLVAADRLANMKDPETGKPALGSRQLAAVCMQIAENKDLPEALRKRALFDPARPRLSFLLNELEAEEAAMMAPGVSTLERQNFMGTINGFHSDDIKQNLLRMIGEQKDSADIRAMAAMSLDIANKQKLEDRVGAMLEYTRNIYGASDAKISNRSETKDEAAKWYVERLKADFAGSIENQPGKSADTVRQDRLRAALMLRGLNKLNENDAPFLSPEEYNKGLLECVTRTTSDGKGLELSLSKGSPELSANILSALSVPHLTTAQRSAVVGALDLSTASGDAKANDAAEQAKLVVLAMLPMLVEGQTDAALELRSQARAKLQANLDPEGKLFAGNAKNDRPTLRAAMCYAAGEAKFDDAKTVALLKKTFDLAEDKTFFESSPVVRRAALEALAMTSTNDAIDVAKILKGKTETDPAIARRAAAIADLARVQEGGGKDREEVRQDIVFKLADKSKANFGDGKAYLENSKFKLLNWANFAKEYERVQVAADPGQDSIFSLSRAWSRVSNFDYNMPDKLAAAAASALESDRRKMPDQLVETASRHQDAEEARKAILALGFGLETKAESFAPNTADANNGKINLQARFAQGLRDLCGKDVAVGPGKTEINANKHRALVASICENFVTGSQQIDWQSRYHLYEGLKKLRADRAISPADYADILVRAMEAPIKHQIFPTNERESNWCKAVYSEMMDELTELKPRDEKTLGLLKGIADGLKKQPGWEATARKASDTLGLLTESPLLIFQEQKYNGSIDLPDALAQRMSSAFVEYRERLATAKTEEEIRKNRDNLIAAIFKGTEGVRIDKANDPRVRELFYMACNVKDTTVKAALGIAMLRARDGETAVIGRILCAEVLKTGTPYQQSEMQSIFDSSTKTAEANAKAAGTDPLEARKRYLENVEKAKQQADSKINGTLISGRMYQIMTENKILEKDPTKVDLLRVLATKRSVEDLMAKPETRPEQFSFAMMDMMYQGALTENDPRLALNRRIVMENFSDSMKLSTAFATLFYGINLPEADTTLMMKTLEQLSTNSANAVVKAEATRLLTAWKKK